MIAITDLSFAMDPVGSYGFVILLTAVLAVVLIGIAPDRSRIDSGKLQILVLLRLLVFVAIVMCMLRPTIIYSEKTRQPAEMIVLADGSKSMSVTDGPGGQSRWEWLVSSVERAKDAANALRQSGDFTFAAWMFDKQTHSVSGTDSNPLPFKNLEDSLTSEETAIGAAIDDAVRASAGKNLAGLLLLSDGSQHAYPPRDLPPQSVARRLADLGIPVWSVTFGDQRSGSQSRDASVVGLVAAETVYQKNSLEIAGRIKLDGLADRECVVKLLAETDSGVMQEVARQTVRAGNRGEEIPVRLPWVPDSVGERKLVLAVELQEGEIVQSNNELSTFVNVLDGGLRVFYLEGTPRVEQRFLRRALALSPDIQVDFQWINSDRRREWPMDLERQLASEYSVFLLGDIDSEALRAKDIQTITAKVRAGAGIGMLGGFHSFNAGGWGSTALAPALPFEPDRLARQSFDQPIREDLHLRGPIKMIPDQRFGAISILKFGGNDQQSLQAWQSLPPFEGANQLGRLVPTTKPLAATENGQPILVARDYGEGRVLAFAADSTWRWVMADHAEEHRRFWRQMILWLAKKDDSESGKVWLRLSQRRASPGTAIQCDAGVTSTRDEIHVDMAMDGILTSPSKKVRPIRIAKDGEAFTGTLGELVEPGDWKLKVSAHGTDGGEIGTKEARFTIYRQDLELANPIANVELMRQLADATANAGGGVRAPEDISDIFRAIAEKPAEFVIEKQESFTPWDSGPLLFIVLSLMSFEWFLRKKWGLV